MRTSDLGRILPAHFDSAFIETMKSWEPEIAAQACDDRVRVIERTSKLTFVELGQILEFVDSKELWRKMAGKWHSFDQWISRAAPVCRSSGYAALKAVRELKDIPADELAEMTQANVCMLAKVDKTERTPKIIEAAKSEPVREFTATAQRECPNSHIMRKLKMVLRPDENQRAAIDLTIDMAMELDPEIVTREEALSAICIEYGQVHLQELRTLRGEPKETIQ